MDNLEKPVTSYRSNRNRFDYNLDFPSSSSTTQDISTCTSTSQKKSTPIKLTDASLHRLTTVCDRYGVSDRAAAAIVSSVLCSTSNAESEVHLTNVVDRMKLRGIRKKVRKQISIEEKIMYIPAL